MAITPPPTPAAPHPSRAGMVLLGVAVVLSLYWSWSTHERMRSVEQELVRRQQDQSALLAQLQVSAKESDELARETAAKAAVQEARLNEVATQRTQLDELLQSLASSRDENLLSALDASLRVAQQQAALTGSVDPLMIALQSAKDRLQRQPSARLEPLRRALNADTDRIKSVPVADIGVLAGKLDEAARLIDALPLLNEPRVSDAQAPQPAHSIKKAATAVPVAANTEEAWWQAASGQVQAGLKQWGQAVIEQLLSLVRLTKIEHPESVLIAPDQALILRTNLKLRVLNARLALLSRQFALVRSDVGVTDDLLDRYFDPGSRKTREIHALLQDVRAQLEHTDLPRPQESLAALASLQVSH